MIRRPPRSTLDRSSAASDVYKRQALGFEEYQRELYMKYLFQPQGMMLFTGPTGSGKTVSMYTGLGTVSYTHLRAHETVLDLVCRLLLEKKKNYEQV